MKERLLSTIVIIVIVYYVLSNEYTFTRNCIFANNRAKQSNLNTPTYLISAIVIYIVSNSTSQCRRRD